MKPSICPVCGIPYWVQVYYASDSSGNLRFKNFKPLPEGYGGHPQGDEWFCSHHFKDAKSLTNLNSNEAIELLKNRYPITQEKFDANLSAKTPPRLKLNDLGEDSREVKTLLREFTTVKLESLASISSSLPLLLEFSEPKNTANVVSILISKGADIQLEFHY